MFLKTFLRIAIWILIFNPVLFAGSILNPGFEFTDPGTEFDTPTDWTVENYAAAVDTFIPSEYNGSKDAWKIDLDTGLSPYQGQKLALLSNGSSDTTYGKMYQQIYVEAGDKITGAYFFGVCDYSTWDDYAYIKLIALPESGLSDVEIVAVSLIDVGNYSSTEGWVEFESIVFDESNAGRYILEIAVYDQADSILESYFAVDGLAIVPEPASVILLLSGFCLLRRKKIA
ncbi:MAG: hypothetical protein A2Y12_12775 [Planctomycetes bacterium GWF2_42_9]|nr:MAG: hypothetical protein A2Y12_12775 [Planctomycetes bacterium GWF2_42_9]